MNYREQQLRLIIKKDYVPKSQYQQEIKELQKATNQELINTLQKDLGINFLLDYQQILDKLGGRTVEEVLNELTNQIQSTKQLAVEKINLSVGLNKQIQALTLLAEKRKEDLEREKEALIALAKQKLTNKKEASALLKQLENKWSQEKEEWEQQQEELINQHHQAKEQWESDYKEKESEWKKDKENSKKVIQELQKQLTTTQQSLTTLQTTSNRNKQEQQDRLRKINLLFDEQAGSYERIDFNGLYSLLEKIKQTKNLTQSSKTNLLNKIDNYLSELK